MRACTHGGGAHRQWVSTTFWLGKTLTNCIVLQTGFEPLIMESIGPRGGRSTNWATTFPFLFVLIRLVLSLYQIGSTVAFRIMHIKNSLRNSAFAHGLHYTCPLHNFIEEIFVNQHYGNVYIYQTTNLLLTLDQSAMPKSKVFNHNKTFYLGQMISESHS